MRSTDEDFFTGYANYYVGNGAVYTPSFGDAEFKGRSFSGDELRVHTTISRIGTSSLTAEMTVVREQNETTVAAGFITGVVVGSNTARPTPVPAEFRAAITSYQDG